MAISYARERDQFIVDATRAGLSVDVAQTLLRCATTLQRLAELACSSEAADRDRVPCPRKIAEKRYATAKIATAVQAFEQYPCLCDYDHTAGQHTTIPRIRLQDRQCEQRAVRAVGPSWMVVTNGDPRGAVLSVYPAGTKREDIDSGRASGRIYVPARESRLRF